MAICTFLLGATPSTKHGGLTYTPQLKGIQDGVGPALNVQTYKSKVKPLVQWSAPQNDQRQAVSAAARYWQTLSPSEQDSWAFTSILTTAAAYPRFAGLNTLNFAWGLQFLNGWIGAYTYSGFSNVSVGHDTTVDQDFLEVFLLDAVPSPFGTYVHLYCQFSDCGYEVIAGGRPPNGKQLLSPPPRASGFVYIGTTGPFYGTGSYVVYVGNALTTMIGFAPVYFNYDPVLNVFTGGGMSLKMYITDINGKPFVIPPFESDLPVPTSEGFLTGSLWQSYPGEESGLAHVVAGSYAPSRWAAGVMAKVARATALGGSLGKWGR